MTVRELVTLLSRFDGDLQVEAYDEEADISLEIRHTTIEPTEFDHPPIVVIVLGAEV